MTPGQSSSNQSGETSASLQPTAADPPQGEENTFRLLRLVSPAREDAAALHELKVKVGLGQLIGQSPAFLAVVKKIPTFARSEANVLISGETGTGKEVCARAIHYLSARSPKPFIAVNCGAIPADLVENELFGHERGAFTDARENQRGLIAEAEGGTLFLDEIDSLPLLAQVKLLRFLQEREYRSLGSSKTKTASVRIICATNTDLTESIRQSTFRRDLYYRINILPIVLPPLRDRSEDILLLAQHFRAQFSAEYAKPVVEFSPEVLLRLRVYSWPGNVRELEHVIERAVALAETTIISEVDLETPATAPKPIETFQAAKDRAVAQFERTYLKEALQAYAGNITKAAQAAGKNRRAFWQLLRRHGFSTHSLSMMRASEMDKR